MKITPLFLKQEMRKCHFRIKFISGKACKGIVALNWVISSFKQNKNEKKPKKRKKNINIRKETSEKIDSVTYLLMLKFRAIFH